VTLLIQNPNKDGRYIIFMSETSPSMCGRPRHRQIVADFTGPCRSSTQEVDPRAEINAGWCGKLCCWELLRSCRRVVGCVGQPGRGARLGGREGDPAAAVKVSRKGQ
jgi:hypothetical protein